KAFGFTKLKASGLDSGLTDQVMVGKNKGSYLVYRGIDFTEKPANQFRGLFGVTNPDIRKQVTIEIRLDAINGERIGKLTLFKQWKQWSIFASDIEYYPYLTSIHDIYLVIANSEPSQQLMVKWLAFTKKKELPAPKSRPTSLLTPFYNK